ncbi:protein SUPPRESSOR OF npr1-1, CONSTITUTIVE 1-like [Cajanus cajan]|uniref:protein SUPPRESSOR OF npr1-1, CONSTITUTIVE 1-like n=1 Tax=Cajanus cajan TaxID=3821 RepID=UPI0010FB7BF3|nr:protein SUPPRESSOR OF npr1-1, CONSTITUTIVE 1-like [Cajanus cajan]
MSYFFISCSFLCVLFLFVSWLFPKLKGVEEQPKSDNSTPQVKYDVFVSFRGEDIRHGFLSHLIDTFQRKKINAFVDDKLERGDEIWPSLVRAIEGSFISLIIFSQDYASSHWCLEELVTILECREKHGQIVIPVFYHVEPTHVRHQLGSYKNAFAEHGRKYKTKVQSWRHALNKSADLSGIESSKFQNDAELLKAIVDLVLLRLGKHVVNLKGLVGIDTKVADVESLICKPKEPKDIRLIGIWGMGGIGKTTLAEELFNKLRFDCEYDGCYFLANEREQSSKHDIIFLKERIFSELLGNAVKIDTPNSLPNDVVWRIGRMKVLIVLDDVNESDHLEKLLGTLDNFGSGSRIIVTTRDEQVLNANKADDIYQLREFSFNKALELFNLNAFNQSDHQREYDDLSKRVVDYANGIPLVLKVLAHLLRGKNREVWESELDKLKKMPLTKVYDVMKLSYDDLDRKEQQIFLDLACFFLRSGIQVDVGYLKSLLKDGESDNSVVAGLEKLKDKALITFSEDNFVDMHDSLQEMACEIVRRESIEVPRSRSRLWDPDDIYEALKNDKGTEAIRSIQIQLPTIEEQKLSPHIFAKMSRLRFLEIYVEYNHDCFNEHNILAEGLQYLAAELRLLYWWCYPLKSLPDNFSIEKLVILRLRNGKIEKLWDGVKNLVNLEELDLSDSEMLRELPDLSKATNLEALILSRCSMLTSVHPSVFSLRKLETLDLQDCMSLAILTSDSTLCNLSYLDLGFCNNLTQFSLISENMKGLRVQDTKVKEFPSSFGLQTKLEWLILAGNDIERLPSSIKNLTHLEILNVNFCSSLQSLPELPQFLKALCANNCKSLQTLPELPQFLETLDAKYCSQLQTLPELPPFLKSLNAQSCSLLQTLPELPPFLKDLNVGTCKSLQNLPELPPFLETLNANFCTSLQTLPELPLFLKTLNVDYCTSLQILPKLPSFFKTLLVDHCTSLQILPELPLSLATLTAQFCTSLQNLPKLPPSLEYLNTQSCTSLQTLPELPRSLKTLNFTQCKSFLTLPKLPPSLQTLNAQSCTSLQTLPELPSPLKTLNAQYCTSLQTLPELPSSLQTLNAQSCTSLQTLPDLPSSLKTLNVQSCTSLQNLPKLPLSLETLDVNCCTSLQTLPELSKFLKTLNAQECKSLKTLPELPQPLETLDVKRCTSLQNLTMLPSFVKTLNVQECESLQTLPNLPSSLKTLDAKCCTSLQALPKLPPSLETLDVKCCTSLKTLPELPQSLKTLNVEECETLENLPELPLSIETINAKSCISLQTLWELPMFLKTLNVQECKSLQTLPELPLFLETLNVMYCNSLQTLPELPPFLKTLNAKLCESLQTLPKLPHFLETLDIEFCTSLQTLPEFPPFLKIVYARDCGSLKTVLCSPSTTVQELKETWKHVILWNCLNVGEYSLVAIGLNAQINMMKFANQHLSSANLIDVKNYDDYCNHRSYQAVYAYPGSSVPEWLEYKTTKDYIIVDLSSIAPSSSSLGFIFCFVLGKYYDETFIDRLDVNITISDGEGEGEKDSVRMYIDYWGMGIELDHVCIMYDQRCSGFLNTRAKNQTRFKIEVTLWAKFLYPETYDDALPQQVLKGFGVSPISTSTYNSFIQQMELNCGSYHPRVIKRHDVYEL